MRDMVTPWAWCPPVLWRCLRCDHRFLTVEAGPRCPRCGYQEGDVSFLALPRWQTARRGDHPHLSLPVCRLRQIPTPPSPPRR